MTLSKNQAFGHHGLLLIFPAPVFPNHNAPADLVTSSHSLKTHTETSRCSECSWCGIQGLILIASIGCDPLDASELMKNHGDGTPRGEKEGENCTSHNVLSSQNILTSRFITAVNV